mgnify:CR=1 FL=1|jgi:hypothetical protein
MTMMSLDPAHLLPAGWFFRLIRGQSVADLYASLRARHVEELLPVAMACHGIDTATLDDERRQRIRDLRQACAQCPRPRACRRLLANADLEAHRRLCPNEDTLESLEP